MPHEPDIEELTRNAQDAAGLLRSLANARRLEVLCALRGGELSVGRLSEQVKLSQSALSQHLARLRSDRIVAARRQGQSVFYSIADPAALTVVEALAAVMRLRRAEGN
jgi:ArsR family transcriptional regulator